MPRPTDRSPSSAGSALEARSINVKLGRTTIIEHADLTVEHGQIVALVGPNGCGKTTLLRAVAGLTPLTAGTVTVAGAPLDRLSRRATARHLAFMPQHLPPVDGLTALQLVAHGRYAQRGPIGMLSGGIDDICHDALTRVGASEFAQRPLDELSGGERQRVRLAVALAQQTPLLLLDEPTTYLDLTHQIELLGLLDDLRHDGIAQVVVLHDLTHAAWIADQVVVMHEGSTTATGPPTDVLTPTLINDVFGVDATLETRHGQLPALLVAARRRTPNASQNESIQQHRQVD